jgi:opacity protein-like surface antigen
MKKFCLSALLAAVLMLPGFAQAESTGVYVTPKFVLNMQSTEIEALGASTGTLDDTTAGGALAVGYDFSQKFNVPVRAELEFGAFGALSEEESYDIVSAKPEVGIKTLLANVYWDIADYNGFTPYVGAGLGMAWVNTEISLGLSGYGSASADNTETVAAAQIGIGCSYAFNETFAVDLGYRCLAVGDGKVEIFEATNNVAHQIMLGLRVTF